MTCILPGVPHVSGGSHSWKKSVCEWYDRYRSTPTANCIKCNRCAREKKLLGIFLFVTPQIPTVLAVRSQIGRICDRTPGTKSLKQRVLIYISSSIALECPAKLSRCMELRWPKSSGSSILEILLKEFDRGQKDSSRWKQTPSSSG